MKRPKSLVLLVGLSIPAAAAAQLGGTWDINASFNDPRQELSCSYSGTGMLTEMRDQVIGPINLTLNPDNSQACPGEMVGQLVATVNGSSFTGTIDGSNNPGGDLGNANVSGTIMMTPPAQTAKEAMTSMSGTSDTTSGPFQGASGPFSGTLRAMTAPAAGPVALAVLALVLLGGSTLLLVRRRA